MDNERLTDTLENMCIHLKNLGWGKADTLKRGAIEDLSEHIEKAGITIANSIDQLTESVSDLTSSLEKVAKIK